MYYHFRIMFVRMFFKQYTPNFNCIQEAIFESSPQILLSMGWILKSSLDGVPISPIIVVSTLFSLWSLTSKVAADDKLILHESSDNYEAFKSLNFRIKAQSPFIYFNWQYLVRVILWRFFEITDRIILCLLIWVNIGGLPLLIILGFELICCVIMCFAEQSYVSPSTYTLQCYHKVI